MMMIGGFKKGIRIILIILMLTGICYAEGNYRKTKMEPWIYQAMGFLKQKGLIADYPVAWVNSGNQLSRFEIAYYIKGLITNQSAAPNLPDGEVEILRKLIAEFQLELTDLGVQITDIDQVHPNLAKIVPEVSEYQDLDNIISKTKVEIKQPSYYFGQYFSKQQKKSFIFIPMEYVRSNYAFLLNGDESSYNVFYQPPSKNPILVVKSNLPLNNLQSVSGYYLFPIELKSNFSIVSSQDTLNVNDEVLPLLDEVNQIQRIDSLWSVNGILPLNGYLPQEMDLKTRAFVGNLNQGLKIGDLLVYTEDFNDKKVLMNSIPNISLSNSIGGVGTANGLTVPVDLDAIEGTNLQTIQLNKEYPMIPPAESTLRGMDLLYWDADPDKNIKGDSNSKANAGINYHLNDYWTFLAYQSLDNSKLEAGWLTTTSLGINYNDWVTLWLAYRLVDFDKPVVSGSLALHF
jgi:hypothetical protein